MIDRRLASQNKLWPFFFYHSSTNDTPRRSDMRAIYFFERSQGQTNIVYLHLLAIQKSFLLFFRKYSCCFSLSLFRSLWYIIHLTRLVGIQVVKHFFDLFFLTHPHRRSTYKKKQLMQRTDTCLLLLLLLLEDNKLPKSLVI